MQATAGVPILGGFVALAAAIVAYSAPSFAASIISGSSNSNFGQFSGMLMNLASTSLSSVSNAIKGYAEAGEEAALTAVSLGAVAATGGAAAPALAGGELAVTAPETTLGASEFGGATSPARSGGMPSSTGGASGTPSGNSGSGGGASELDNIDILNMLPEEDAATQAITSPFDGFAGITNTVATLSPSDPHSSTGAVSIRIGV
jgi:hypothetical protein